MLYLHIGHFGKCSRSFACALDGHYLSKVWGQREIFFFFFLKKQLLFKDSLNWSKVWVKKPMRIYRTSRIHSLLLSMQAEAVNEEQKQRRVHKDLHWGQFASGIRPAGHSHRKWWTFPRKTAHKVPMSRVYCEKLQSSEGFGSHNTHRYHPESVNLPQSLPKDHSYYSYCYYRRTITRSEENVVLTLAKLHPLMLQWSGC